MSEKDMQKLLALVERSLGKEWVGIGEWLRSLDANSLAEIERRLYAGDITAIVQGVDDAARTFAAASHKEYIRSGETAAKWLDDQPALKDTLVRFDAANEHAVRAARRNELELVQGLTQESRQVVYQAIVDGQRAGLNPRQIAVDIRDSITLTPTQAKHVANYRRALESGDYGNALGRELRDARSDRTLQRLRRDGGSLTSDQVDRMVDRYRQNYVTYRAETIARTESAANVHAGLQEAYRQSIDRGDIDADQLVREWIAGPKTKDARPDHAAMDGTKVKFGEPFVFPDGTKKMYPGDGAGGPAHDANCRCTVAVTMTHVKRARSTLGRARSTLGPFPGEGMYADIMRAAGRLA